MSEIALLIAEQRRTNELLSRLLAQVETAREVSPVEFPPSVSRRRQEAMDRAAELERKRRERKS